MKKCTELSDGRWEVNKMPLDNEANVTSKGFRSLKSKSARLIGLLIVACLVVLGLPPASYGDPLDYSSRWSLGVDGYLSTIEGRMGFDQQPGGFGTLNDLKTDLGLPNDNKSFRINASVRPLEHHLLRVFGSVPELYRGGTTLERDLRLTQITNNTATGTGNALSVTFQEGHWVKSEMRYATFGLGYDLDFLVAPTWLAGFNGEFRYLDLRMRIFTQEATTNGVDTLNNVENSINVDEPFPCLGGHAYAMIPFGGVGVGAFTRMSFGLTPNYLNYVDMTMGLSLRTGLNGGVAVMAKVGYEHESIFHDTNNRAGQVMELKRNGILISLDGTF
jgi:hypothetical protein